MLYFAYGMNLDPDNMWDHGEVGSAVLKDWQLELFTHANVRPCKGAVVHGAVWKVEDFTSLDKREGYPHYYDRCEVVVETADGPVQAIVYYQNDAARKHSLRVGGKPGPYYLEMLIAGYKYFGLPEHVLKEAL